MDFTKKKRKTKRVASATNKSSSLRTSEIGHAVSSNSTIEPSESIVNHNRVIEKANLKEDICMLHFCDVGLSQIEVPGESTLCFYISGCINRCKNCHYPELQFAGYGEKLDKDRFQTLVDLYSTYATCICFMGEGNCSVESRKQLCDYANIAGDLDYKVCLYSGRDTVIEEWMNVFDYVKLGSYKEALGPLYSYSTNQRFYKKMDGKFVDSTYLFWEMIENNKEDAG